MTSHHLDAALPALGFGVQLLIIMIVMIVTTIMITTMIHHITTTILSITIILVMLISTLPFYEGCHDSLAPGSGVQGSNPKCRRWVVTRLGFLAPLWYTFFRNPKE